MRSISCPGFRSLRGVVILAAPPLSVLILAATLEALVPRGWTARWAVVSILLTAAAALTLRGLGRLLARVSVSESAVEYATWFFSWSITFGDVHALRWYRQSCLDMLEIRLQGGQRRTVVLSALPSEMRGAVASLIAIALPPALQSGWADLRLVHRRPGACIACAHPLANAMARCPECGAPSRVHPA